MRFLILLFFSALPCAAQVVLDEPTPPGYPPKLGTVALVEAGKTRAMETYDFSIGAFDASAWFGEGLDGRGFNLVAYPEGNPKAETGLLKLYGAFETWAPGPARAGLVEVTIGKGFFGRRWTSAGQPVELVIESFEMQDPGQTSGYGHVTGHFAARICSGDKDPAVVAPGARCREVSGQFDTDVQYSP